MESKVFATIPLIAAVLDIEEETVRRTIFALNGRCPGTVAVGTYGEYCLTDYIQCTCVDIEQQVLREIEETVRTCSCLRDARVP